MTSNTKGNKEKFLQKLCDHREDINFFPWGRYDWDRCHLVHVLMGTIDAKKKKTMESYAPGLFHLKQPLKMP